MHSLILISPLRLAPVLGSLNVIILQNYHSITKTAAKDLCKYLDRIWFWQALLCCAWVLHRIESCQTLLYQFFCAYMQPTILTRHDIRWIFNNIPAKNALTSNTVFIITVHCITYSCLSLSFALEDLSHYRLFRNDRRQ